MPRPFHLGERTQVQPPARSMPRLPCSLGYSKQEGLQWLMNYKHDIQFEKSTTGARLSPGSRVCFKQTVEPRLPFLFQNEWLSPGSRGDFKQTVEPRLTFILKHAVKPRLPCL